MNKEENILIDAENNEDEFTHESEDSTEKTEECLLDTEPEEAESEVGYMSEGSTSNNSEVEDEDIVQDECEEYEEYDAEDDYKNVISYKREEAKKLMTHDQIKKCNVIIHAASVAAGAEAYIPIPVVDAVPITATQIAMIIALGKVFDQKISESAAKALVSAAASTFVGRSLVKIIPVAGWIVSSIVAAGVTEAIGWIAAVDFANIASKTVSLSKVIDWVEDDSEDDEDYYEEDDYEDED